MKLNMSTDLCGIKLDNPVMAASGTFGYGREFAEIYDINILGSFSFKGTTPKPRFGNETPRIAESPEGMLNSVGLQNPGVNKVLEEEMSRLKKIFNKPVMANLCGSTPKEYAQVAEKLDSCDQIGWMEVNISCPNVKEGGLAFGADPKAAASVIREVRKATKRPVIAKLSPNVTDITEIARACEAEGADGITAINTIMGMRIDKNSGRPLLGNTVGGLSGPAVLPVAIRCVYQIARAVDIPIAGCGGITDAEDVIEMMMAGAGVVQVGTANLVDPEACKKIIDGLPKAMERYGIEDIRDIVGVAAG